MKLVQSFEKHLRENLQEVYIIDERGDAHHVEIVAIDSVFTDMNRLQRSRYVFEILGDFLQHTHATTVKTYTPDEWKKGGSSFTPTRYVHLT